VTEKIQGAVVITACLGIEAFDVCVVLSLKLVGP
jgi:hypothetical protein